MDPMAGLTVYNVPSAPPKWDRVGRFYVAFCATWTTLVLAGMTFCWLNRHNPILKIRALKLSFAAILFLHCYWVLAQVVYPVGQSMPAVLAYDVQYFFMGIWLPLGIAMFQAANLRFLYVAKLQKQFMHPALRSKHSCNGAKTSWLCWLRNMEYTLRVMIFIGTGMIFQVLLTVGMWLACKKYHPTYGIPGTDIKGSNLLEQLVDLGRGWEWWPTLLWQFIWAWIVAPILIWRAWSIRDTMGWRTQTIGCCLANLHAAPMFLIASYVPVFVEKVNMWFAPSEWIHLSIMFFEVFTVFVPAVLVIRQKIASKKAADMNAKWETSSQTSTLRGSAAFDWKKPSFSEKSGSIDFNDEELGDRLLTMGALDHVLTENPAPLQEFSALRDFSGENIAFLTRTSRWKTVFEDSLAHDETRIDAYNHALDIYTDFISPRDAEFPLNLSSQELKHLEDIFEKPARIVCGDARINPATPFDVDQASTSTEPKSAWDLEAGPAEIRARYTGEIPESFDIEVFDNVACHIKYLVLTNTWPKFVSEMQNRRRSSETGRSHYTQGSQTTLGSLGSKVSNVIRKLSF